MADQKHTESDASARREPDRTNRSQTSGSNAAGTGNNPQDGKDAGGSGDSRPRGKTEDPERTL